MRLSLFIALIIPFIDLIFETQLTAPLRTILVFILLGIGLNIVTGFAGILHLGSAALMAIGAYTYAILTTPLYPFQINSWIALLITLIFGLLSGALVGLPATRLRGDYLAIVTLGFGEIVQDILKNVDLITKGVQGINPIPGFSLGLITLSSNTPIYWHYFLLTIVMLSFIGAKNLENSRIGRAWQALREDELATKCMGISTIRLKLWACAFAGLWCALAGALWVAIFGTTGEPSNYDFNISILALCIVIVGGLGSLKGIIFGAVFMIGLNSIVLPEASRWMIKSGLAETTSVFLSPSNWKYLIFGLALILVMRTQKNSSKAT